MNLFFSIRVVIREVILVLDVGLIYTTTGRESNVHRKSGPFLIHSGTGYSNHDAQHERGGESGRKGDRMDLAGWKKASINWGAGLYHGLLILWGYADWRTGHDH